MAIEISVVIPTYREEAKILNQNVAYLKEQTAFKQKRMEIIIADFYEYIDNTRVWPAQNEQFKVVHVDRRGIAYARHFGIMASKGKVIVNFDADGYFLADKEGNFGKDGSRHTNEAIDILTRPILEGWVHQSCCDNVHSTAGLTKEQIQSIDFINNILYNLNNMQRTGPVVCLESGFCFSMEAYKFVGGFSDVRQYEAAALSAKIMWQYPLKKAYISHVKAVLSPRRALASAQYGLLNAYSNYAEQSFR